MGDEQVHRTVEAVWRIEAGRVIAALAGLVRDVGWAEELAQDALVAALEQWPRDGVPANPGAWLTTVGKRRAIDALRRRSLLERRVADLGRDLGDEQFTPTSTPPSRNGSTTTSCAWSSPPATRCCRRRRGRR